MDTPVSISEPWTGAAPGLLPTSLPLLGADHQLSLPSWSLLSAWAAGRGPILGQGRVSPRSPSGAAKPSGGNAYFLAQVFLSTRRGAWIFNRVGEQGYPIDTIITTRTNAFLKKLLSQSMVSNFVEKQLNARFDHSHYGLKPKHRCQQMLPLPRRDPLPPPFQHCSAVPMLCVPGLGTRHQPWKLG